MKNMNYLKYARQVEWTPHPAGLKGVTMKKLRTRDEGEYRESVAIVRVDAGAAVPPHIHEQADDNLYILTGKARMRVDREEFAVAPGAQITVPAGIEHEIFAVTETLEIYDVFAPPLF
jgi:quercetin dioxygenase-like cupin family protein